MTSMETKRTVYDIGEIKIDGLEPTPEMRELLKKEKCGEITVEEIRDMFNSRGYRMKLQKSGKYLKYIRYNISRKGDVI